MKSGRNHPLGKEMTLNNKGEVYYVAELRPEMETTGATRNLIPRSTAEPVRSFRDLRFWRLS
jgi:hypothetical protein